MTIEIRVPTLGESVTEATVGQWFKKAGDAVKADEMLVELETDKVMIEVRAPANGVLADISIAQGATIAVGGVLGTIREGAAGAAPETVTEKVRGTAPNPASPAAPPQPAAPAVTVPPDSPAGPAMPPSPAAARVLREAALPAEGIAGSGRRGQILKEDVQAGMQKRGAGEGNGATDAAASARQLAAGASALPVPLSELRVLSARQEPGVLTETGRESRVKMTRLRQTIARRLKEAQNNAAMLTTFNDVDMGAVMQLRTEYKELFEKRHGLKLGFMGFFVKACLAALKEIPAVNAEIDGGDIVYKNYYHIGVAVGTDKGLVVPVVRDADRLSIAEIEGKIAEFGKRARAGKLTIEDLQGGTFTISNGGVYGSMLSTPILNAPQSGILGMHRIEERPVVRSGQVIARPMMYLALSYDHRLVDGREAVTFLVRVKECLEDPRRFLLEI